MQVIFVDAGHRVCVYIYIYNESLTDACICHVFEYPFGSFWV